MFIDDDAIAHERRLARLLSTFDDPQVVGVGGHARPLWETAHPGWLPPEFLWVVGCSYAGLPEAGEVRAARLQHAFRAGLFEAVVTSTRQSGVSEALPPGVRRRQSSACGLLARCAARGSR